MAPASLTQHATFNSVGAPTEDPTWDSNGTNVLGGGTTSGHKTDGWVTDEVVDSAGLNYWMMAVGKWINYLKDLASTQTLIIPLFEAGGDVIGIDIVQPPVAHNNNLAYPIPLPALRVGSKITAIRTRITEGGTAGIPAWVATTTYAIGNRVKNGSNVYVCTTAGTSAGSGGPTGTGTGITDNTCVWDFVVALGSPGDGPVGISIIRWTDGGGTTIASKQGDNHTDGLVHSIDMTGLSITVAAGNAYFLYLNNSGCADGQTMVNAEMDITILP